MSSVQALRAKVAQAAGKMNELVKFDADGNAITPWNDEVAAQFAEAKTAWEGAKAEFDKFKDAIEASRAAERSRKAITGVADRHGLSFDEVANRTQSIYNEVSRANRVAVLNRMAQSLGGGIIERLSADPSEDDMSFENYLRGGRVAPSQPQDLVSALAAATRAGFRNTWTQGTDAEGGYLASERFSDEVVISLLSTSAMLRAADVQTTDFLGTINHPNITAVKGNVRAAGAASVENVPATGNSPIDFDKFDSGFVNISDRLVYSTTYNLVGVLSELFGMNIGSIQEEVFTVGSMEAGIHSRGFVEDVPAGNVQTGAAGEDTALKYDTITQGMHLVKQGYRRRGAVWMMNDMTLGQMRALTDSQGRPLWLPMVADSDDSALLGFRVEVNDEMPDQAADAYPISFGWFRAYKIFKFDRPQVEVFTQDKTDRTKGEISYLGQEWAGGRLVDSKAISRIRNSS